MLRPLAVGRVRIRFFFTSRMALAVTEKVKTSSGYIPVSTPEMTAYDLVRYRKGAGSIDHVATVLSELAERLDARRLLAIATSHGEMPVIQRLGYLLEATGHAELTNDIAGLVDRANRSSSDSSLGTSGLFGREQRWRVLLNTTIEVEA